MPDSVRVASPAGSLVLVGTLIIAAASAGSALAGTLPVSIAVVALVAVACTIGVGVSVPSSGVFARPVLGATTGRREVALTFDDGPDPRWTPPLLDLLDERGHRATFFVVGKRAEQHADLLAEISRRGHEVANHSWAHSPGTVFASPHRLARELERTSALIARATGIRPQWFRPPVGLLSPRIPRAAREAGLRLVTWTASARDGIGSTTVARAFANLDAFIAPGAILVLHDAAMYGDRAPVARDVLQLVLDRLTAADLTSVTLSDLCSVAPPVSVHAHAGGDGRANNRAEHNAKTQPADGPRQ